MSGIIDYIRNKKIIVIGPAPSCMALTRAFVDTFDVIVRFNDAIPVKPEYRSNIHERTDILVNCLHPHPQNGGETNIELWKKEIQWLFCPVTEQRVEKTNPDKEKLMNEKGFNKFFVSNDFYEQFRKRLDTDPNSGTVFLEFLAQNQVFNRVYVSGITFFKTAYYPGSSKKLIEMPRHDPAKQFDYFKSRIYKKIPNIEYDKCLTAIMEG